MLSSSKMQTPSTNFPAEGARKNANAEPKSAVGLWLSLALVAAVAPIWISSTLPTSDGGSHLYNAMIAEQVRAGKAPFDSWFVLRGNPRSNFATDSILSLLGPLFGWEKAERILASLVVVTSGLLFYRITRTALSSDYASTISAWLANNWFFWMGFYDFSLSIAAFAGLVIALRNSKSQVQWLWIGVSLSVLYATHLFTFAMGTTLFAWVLLWRVARGQIHHLAPAIAVLPFGLLTYELLTGPVGSGGVSWGGWKAFERAFGGWIIGDFLITFTWIGLIAGTAVMFVTWAGLFGRLRGTICSKRWDPLDLFAVAAFAVSLVVPDHIGAGLYTAARIRFITVILLLPSTALFLSASPIANAMSRRYVVAATLVVGLVVQGAWIVRISYLVTQQLVALEQTLRVAGVTKGALVTAALVNLRAAALRITAYAHLPERAYLRLGVCGLDNYEAALGNFEVQWRRPPDILTVRPSNSGWSISRNVRGLPWQNGLWVLYDANRNLFSSDPALHVLSVTTRGPFKVVHFEVR